MKKLIKSSIFMVGFLCGIPMFLFSMVTLDRQDQIICFDCQMPVGFPFAYYQSEGFVEPARYLWFGLIGDVVFGIIFCFMIGLIFKFVWEKFTAKKLK